MKMTYQPKKKLKKKKNTLSFNYEHDIRAGLEAIEQNLQKEAQISTIYGIRNEVSFNKKIIARILGVKDPAGEFGKFVTDIQNLDAYFANQMFYRRNDNGEISGDYVLSQDVVTVLPFEPSVEYKNLQMLDDKKITQWSVERLVRQRTSDPPIHAGIVS